ncbi:unnamed protein product, partial [Iphiclides podalirius]
MYQQSRRAIKSTCTNQVDARLSQHLPNKSTHNQVTAWQLHPKVANLTGPFKSLSATHLARAAITKRAVGNPG